MVRWVGLGVLVLGLFGCNELPEAVMPVKGFVAERYLGMWFEVARLDNSFERGLEQTTAEYSLRSDGGIKVVNKGLKTETGEWKSVEGRAYFVVDSNVAHLRVSFFRPFYGAYGVFGLDSNYQYAFVSGGNLKYLWLLSRTPTVNDSIKADFIAQASKLGFATDKLLWVNHKKNLR